ncbi:DUF3160 domain-containing protein [Candidatus Peregrinibacteria bacterium]|nr:DUF3160 domain-containing protein [Candidatus Peregrinibacteria bacterium]MBT4056247.1 DUF3160 domain-containing protein [Candidatus Peregrinibacteria bacterium]
MFRKTISSLVVFSLMLGVFTGCDWFEDEDVEDDVESEEVVSDEDDRGKVAYDGSSMMSVAEAGTFAIWEEEAISFMPNVPAYSVEGDFENVFVHEEIYLSDDANVKLKENLFVVTERGPKEFFEVYESNRYLMVPNFITTDSVMHTYHLYFDYLLKALEERSLYNSLEYLTGKMTDAALMQLERLEGTEWEDSAKMNLAYFAVAGRLLDEGVDVPVAVLDTVLEELDMIAAHEGIQNSGIFGTPDDLYPEDYSQYIPRGHYTRSEKLGRYFKSMMWFGRMTYRLSNEKETKGALLVVEALENDVKLANEWEALFAPINFFVGEPDDLVFYDYNVLVKDIYGEDFDLAALVDEEKYPVFVDAAKGLRDPLINSMPVFAPFVLPNDRKEEVKGFRFLGQRSTVDAMIMQKLVYRDVDKHEETGDLRMLPKFLDLPAVLGSVVADGLLVEMGDHGYERYSDNMLEMKNLVNGLSEEEWTHNLYWGWVYTLKPYLDAYGEGYPSFMKSDLWKKKELMSFAGSYTELKHDTILYAKQVYAELGGGPSFEGMDDRGYVEPNPDLYNRLVSLIDITIGGLQARGMLDKKEAGEMAKLREICVRLRDISIKELEGVSLTEEEYEFIRAFGGSLEHFWHDTLDPRLVSGEISTGGYAGLLDSSPAALVADIATDPNGAVLEEGTDVFKIYVVVPVEGQLKVAVGSVFGHYEFSWPMEDRLTDEKWRIIMNGWDPNGDEDSDEVPEKPELELWKKEFVSEY